MSSLATSSPVSASTLEYLMRWPVFLLIWLKETFSVSEVAGYSATGQVTSDNRRKPFQLARGAMANSENATGQASRIALGCLTTSDRSADSDNGVNCCRFVLTCAAQGRLAKQGLNRNIASRRALAICSAAK